MFSHEKLHVYNKALDFVAKAAVWTNTWDKKHALVDHLSRASESILLNLAEATRQRGAPSRLRVADYSIGSSLECAACLDLARVKELLSREESLQGKLQLSEVVKMLVGLRKSWAGATVHEEAGTYGTTEPKPLFHHERLDVYQIGLRFMEWFVSVPGADDLSHRALRQVDEAGTGVVLNIAEGNGRYAELDQNRFLQIAQSAAVKAAVHLDLAAQRKLLANTDTAKGKELLSRISSMPAGF